MEGGIAGGKKSGRNGSKKGHRDTPPDPKMGWKGTSRVLRGGGEKNKRGVKTQGLGKKKKGRGGWVYPC